MFSDKEHLKFIEKCKNEKLDIVVTSVVETLGSTYAKAGNIMLVNLNGEFIGVLGSKFLQNKIVESTIKALETRKIDTFESIPLDESSGHGTSKYKIEPFFYEENYGKIYEYIKKPYSVLVFGTGANVTSFIFMANLMSWKTTIIDVKISKEFVKEADEVIELKNLEDKYLADSLVRLKEQALKKKIDAKNTEDKLSSLNQKLEKFQDKEVVKDHNRTEHEKRVKEILGN